MGREEIVGCAAVIDISFQQKRADPKLAAANQALHSAEICRPQAGRGAFASRPRKPPRPPTWPRASSWPT